ncbi:Cytochrome P450 2 sub R member 1 [Chamberlinius hualienensis]
MDNLGFIIQIILFAFFVWTLGTLFKIRQFPPGPWGLPLIGYAPWIGRHPSKTFAKLTKRYGGIFSVNLVGQTVVVLNDWPSIKATLVDQPKHLSGRPPMFISDYITFRKDMALSDGAVCLKQRKLMVKSLKNIGVGSKLMENSLMEELNELIETVDRYNEQNMDMGSLFFKSTIRHLWKFITGETLSDDELKTLSKCTDDLLQILNPYNPLNFVPLLRFVPPNGFGFKKAVRADSLIRKHLESVIKKHQLNKNGSADRDVVDIYLDQMDEQIQAGNSAPPYDMDHTIGALWNLFFAGFETTSTTCNWAFLYMAHFPDVQQKIVEEIEAVVGKDRLPTLNDVPRLTYLQAAVLEIYRYSSVIPLSVPHRTTTETQVFGYQFPKHTTVFQNIYAVHFDPNLWDNPQAFQPERFLSEEKTIKRPPYLMPFSIGPRKCVGKPVVEMELPLIISCLLQKFNFSMPTNQPIPSLEPIPGIVDKPCPYSLYVKRRN